ncbi:hypothetical protein [Pseudomonas allokribbensis]|uniref:hypothetical protein n=1 Tax=Pseudomonas allokribbensis TaxID=2774460 RepID=UPI0017879E53|nr:hypothetical protein [Pseudomonas allokribbensis]
MNMQYSVYANAGALVLLPSGMSAQEQQDVQHSVLFAQLAATRKWLQSSQVEWYSIWQQVLKDSWLQRKVAWDIFAPPVDATATAMDWMTLLLEKSLDDVDAREWLPVLQDIAGLPAADPLIVFLRERIQLPVLAPEDEAGPVDLLRFLVVVAQPGPRLNAVYITLKSSEGGTVNPFSRVFTSADVQGVVEQKFFQADMSAVLQEPIRGVLEKRLEPFAELIRQMPGKPEVEAGVQR